MVKDAFLGWEINNRLAVVTEACLRVCILKRSIAQAAGSLPKPDGVVVSGGGQYDLGSHALSILRLTAVMRGLCRDLLYALLSVHKPSISVPLYAAAKMCLPCTCASHRLAFVMILSPPARLQADSREATLRALSPLAACSLPVARATTRALQYLARHGSLTGQHTTKKLLRMVLRPVQTRSTL